MIYVLNWTKLDGLLPHFCNPILTMSFRLRAFPILTLVHNPKSLISMKALSILQSAHSAKPDKFTVDVLDITKQPPTKDQLSNIVDYLGVGENVQSVLREVKEPTTIG